MPPEKLPETPAAEIERKFFFDPERARIEEIATGPGQLDERFFLKKTPDREVRVQRRTRAEAVSFDLEEKTRGDGLAAQKSRREISANDFAGLVGDCAPDLVRESFPIDLGPGIDAAVKIYRGRHAGLGRLELEFETAAAAQDFAPPAWFGREITDLPIARDRDLDELGPEEFSKILARISGKA